MLAQTHGITSVDSFRESGFAIQNIFSSEELTSFVDAFKALLAMQCNKLNVLTSNDLSRDVQCLNKISSAALSEVLTMVRKTLGSDTYSPRIKTYSSDHLPFWAPLRNC